MNLEERNYWSDHRVIAGLKSPIYKVISTDQFKTKVELSESALEQMIDEGILPENHDGILEGQTKFEVCETCRGSGAVVNPSIDAGGLTPEDFDEDPDFHESYMQGDYDICCPECGGEKVVPRVIFHDEKIAEGIRKCEIAEAQYAREIACERSMGF